MKPYYLFISTLHYYGCHLVDALQIFMFPRRLFGYIDLDLGVDNYQRQHYIPEVNQKILYFIENFYVANRPLQEMFHNH